MTTVWRMAATRLLVAVLATAPATGAAFELVGRHDALSAPEARASQALLDDVAARLPARWRQVLDAPIPVHWRTLPAHVHGRAHRGTVTLQPTLLAGWMAGDGAAHDGRHPRDAARAALIHELAHLYDRASARALSRDPRLLDLAGWQVRPLRAGRTGDNPMRDRTPDAYELTDPAEFVAVNLEHVLLDPHYACRRPQLYRHFAAHFALAPAPGACDRTLPFLDGGAATAGEDAPLLQLDPARVYAVEYLLAEPNRRPMSRWGHSMLRLVVCAPARVPGPDCRQDLDHHRVLSFRAFVDDVQISSWRGLTGGYPSRLFVLPLAQVVEEYTAVELRGLQSVPLTLDTAEIRGLLERAAQLHWSYDGDYYFVGNNCAVETFKLLHDGVPRLAATGLSSITPTGLLRRLQRAGVADASVLDDPETAVRLGHYFPSQDTHYQSMLDVAAAGLGLPQRRVEDWFALRPAQRAPWIERADLRAAAALLVLEQASLRQQELLARDVLKRRMFKRTQRDGNVAGMRDALQAAMQVDAAFSKPAALAPAGYGLPQQDERIEIQRRADEHARRWHEQDARLRETARSALPDTQRRALDATRGNLDAIGRRLRQLHRDAGGMEIGRAQ